MKQSLSTKVLLLMVLMISSTAFSQGKKYIVGVENLIYLPYYANLNGEYTGFSRDLLDAFAKEAGYEFEYKALPVKRLFNDFLKEKVDFKFPDNKFWQADSKKGKSITYSDSVVDVVDGTMVTKANKGKGMDSMKKLGTLLGFSPWPYMDMVNDKKIAMSESTSFTGLIKMTIAGRVDGAYINVEVAKYQLAKLLYDPDTLVFDPELPHSKGSYSISSIKHPDVITQFNEFLKNNQDLIKTLKTKYKFK